MSDLNIRLVELSLAATSACCLLLSYLVKKLGTQTGRLPVSFRESAGGRLSGRKFVILLSAFDLYSIYILVIVLFVFSGFSYMNIILLLFAVLNFLVLLRLLREVVRDGCRSAFINAYGEVGSIDYMIKTVLLACLVVGDLLVRVCLVAT